MLKLGKICFHIIILYSFYLLGNWIQISLNLFIPGSVIGMILLFILLLIKGVKLTWVEEGATFLINNLALFFIPATVGIIDYFFLIFGKRLSAYHYRACQHSNGDGCIRQGKSASGQKERGAAKWLTFS